LMVGDHFFAVTAAHCIRSTQVTQMRVAYRERDYSSHFAFFKKGTLGGSNDDPVDVGYLEIDHSLTQEIPVEFLTLDHLSIEHEPESSVAFLFGFPAKLIPLDKAQQRTFVFRPLGLLTLTATQDSIPNFVDSKLNIVLRYPEQGAVGEQSLPLSLPDPHGISGGSIWVYDPNLANPLIGVHNARLVGIQSSWSETKRIAIGNRIVNLLRLLARDYPDIRDILFQKFGAL
jgi:hypothetical protein